MVQNNWRLLLLGLVLLLALGLRLHGINWDSGYAFHPDERSIYMQSDCMYRLVTNHPQISDCVHDRPEIVPGVPSTTVFFNADESPLNPRWFPIGSLVLYIALIIRLIIEPFLDLGALDMRFALRGLTAFADVGTILFIYLIGVRIYGRRVGLLAAVLIALAAIHIQNAHFFRPEALLVMFVSGAFWAMLRVLEKRRNNDWLLLGVFVGLAFATKVTVLPLIIPFCLTVVLALFSGDLKLRKFPTVRKVMRVGTWALTSIVLATLVFLFWMPYALLDFGKFLNDIAWEAGIAREAGRMPYTVQYIGSAPFWYELRQSTLWGMGVPLGLAAWGGVVFAIYIAFRRRHVGDILLLSWIVPSFLVIGIFEVKFLRYIFPIMPFIILMGSRLLLDAVEWAKNNCPRLTWPAILLVVTVVMSTAFYSLALQGMYGKVHPAVVASRWINDHVPNGTTILTDNHWDEGIPNLGQYEVRQIPIYEIDGAQKTKNLARDLDEGEYLVFYSNRTYGSISRVPERYPDSAHYYRLLFSSQLGYRLEKSFTSYPQFLGIEFIDDPFTRAGLMEPVAFQHTPKATISLNLGYADENVINYDHPRVLIFKKIDRLSRNDLERLLSSSSSIAQENSDLGMMLSKEEMDTVEAAGTWLDIFAPGSWTNRFPVVAWLLLVEMIYIISLPLAYFLLRGLPDRGLALGRVLGLIGVGYTTWLLVSLKWMSFSRASVLVAILIMAALSGLVLWRHRTEFFEFLRRHWGLALLLEGLFIAAFLSFVMIRMANPDLWHPFRGGEKPMDLAYFTAVIKSSSMPPYDPWFSGGYLNYYYWGFFLMGILTKTTGIVPVVAYNLAIPLTFALSVTASFSVVYNLAEGVRRSRFNAPTLFCIPLQEKESVGVGWRWFGSPIMAGIIGMFFVAVIGNLDGVVQLANGIWTVLIHGDNYPTFDFWRSSRVLPDLSNATSGIAYWLSDSNTETLDISMHITEFPFFSFLFGDLHPHVLVIPVTLLIIGLGMSLASSLRTCTVWELWPSLIALAVATGSLWAINAWDYPAYLCLSVAAIALGILLRRGVLHQRLRLFVILVVGLVLISVASFFPYHQSYRTFAPLVSIAKWQTPFPSFMLIHGLFIFVVATFFIVKSWKFLVNLAMVPLPILQKFGDRANPIPERNVLALWMIVTCITLTVMLYAAITGYWTVAFLLALLYLMVLTLRRVLKEKGAEFTGFAVTMVGLALIISVGVDFVRIGNDIGRMNTVFKLYLEVWVLLALASAFFLWYLTSGGFFSLTKRTVLKLIWVNTLGFLLVSSLVYTVLGTRGKLADRFNVLPLTLDGSAYLEDALHIEEERYLELKWDAEAIQWFQENVEGTPVVLEAATEQYRWGSRIATYTGLPTLIGWPWHQMQQRRGYQGAVNVRQTIVTEIYETTDTIDAIDLLRRYRVRYVVVGPLERAYYSPDGLTKFDSMVGYQLEMAYQTPEVKIFKVVD